MITLYTLPVADKKDRAKIIITALLIDALYIVPTIILSI